MVVTLGLTTAAVVPVTVPTPGLMLRLVAPVTVHTNELYPPDVMEAGRAPKLVMAGKAVFVDTVTVAAAVEDPELLAAVSV